MIQGRAVYELRPRLWLSLDGTWYSGGSTTLDGVAGADRQANSRAGLAIPFARGRSLKLSCAKGANARVGSKLDTIGAAWQLFAANRRPPGASPRPAAP